MKLIAAALIFFSHAFVTADDLASTDAAGMCESKASVYFGSGSDVSGGCDCSVYSISQNYRLEVTGCSSRFEMSFVTEGASLVIPPDSGVKEATVLTLSRGIIEAPGLDNITISSTPDYIKEGCIHVGNETKLILPKDNNFQVKRGDVSCEGYSTGEPVPTSMDCIPFISNHFVGICEINSCALLAQGYITGCKEVKLGASSSPFFFDDDELTSLDIGAISGGGRVSVMSDKLEKVTINTVTDGGSVEISSSNLTSVTIDTVNFGASVEIKSITLEELKLGKVLNLGRVETDSPSVKDITFTSVYNEGTVAACNSTNVNVAGDSIVDLGKVTVGSISTNNVDVITRAGQLKTCGSISNPGNPSSASSRFFVSVFGVLLAGFISGCII